MQIVRDCPTSTKINYLGNIITGEAAYWSDGLTVIKKSHIYNTKLKHIERRLNEPYKPTDGFSLFISQNDIDIYLRKFTSFPNLPVSREGFLKYPFPNASKTDWLVVYRAGDEIVLIDYARTWPYSILDKQLWACYDPTGRNKCFLMYKERNTVMYLQASYTIPIEHRWELEI